MIQNNQLIQNNEKILNMNAQEYTKKKLKLKYMKCTCNDSFLFTFVFIFVFVLLMDEFLI